MHSYDKVAYKTELLSNTFAVSNNLSVTTFVPLVNSPRVLNTFPSKPNRALFEVSKNSRTTKSRTNTQRLRYAKCRCIGVKGDRISLLVGHIKGHPKFHAAAHTQGNMCRHVVNKDFQSTIFELFAFGIGCIKFCLCLCPLSPLSLVF